MVGQGYAVVDAHCHVYPAKIAERAVQGTDTFYGLHSVCRGTVQDLMEEGLAHGVDHFVIQSVATTPKQVTGINEFIAEEVAQGKGRLTGLGTLHPESEDLTGDVRRIVRLGLHGVKLHPDIQRFKIDDFRFLRIYELCEEEGLPILMHTGDHRYDFSNPNRMLPILEIFEGLTVVGAHLGGWSVWEDAERMLAGAPNFYVDSSSCFGFLPPERVRELILRFGTDRVLFGTDYPMWHPREELASLLSLGFSEEDMRRMLAENAKKVFSIAE